MGILRKPSIGGFYKLALSDCEAVFEDNLSASEGV